MNRVIFRSSLLLAIVAVSLLLGAPVRAEEPAWKPVGPSGHDGYRLFPTGDPEVLYVTTFNSGLYRTGDGGQSWQRVSPMYFGALSADPRDPDVLFAQSPFGKALRSVDGGRTFTPASDGLLYRDLYPEVYLFLRDPGNPDVVFAATNSGLFRFDGVGHWDLIAFAGSAVTAFAVDPLAPSVWHAATTDPALQGTVDLQVSTDAGATWSQAPGEVGRDEVRRIFFDPVRPHRAYALANCRPAVFQGGAWQLLPLSGSLFSCVSTITDEGRLIASTFANGQDVLWASDDGGATWNRLHTPNDILFRIASPARAGDVLIATGGRGVWRSEDGGATWEAESGNISGFIVGDLAVAADGTLFASPGTEGVFRSRDTGRSWKRVVQGLQADAAGTPTLAVDPRNPAVVWAGGAALHRSLDAGRTWQGLSLPRGVENRTVAEILIDPTRDGVVYVRTYAQTSPGIVGPFNYRTLDNGRSWKPLPGFERRGSGLALSPSDGRLYVWGNDGIFVSRNAGSSWLRVRRSLPTGFVRSITVDPKRPGVLWLASDETGVWRSTDGGRTFANLLQGEQLLGPIGDFAFDPADPEHPYVSVAAAGVYQWSRGGWQKVGADDPEFEHIASYALAFDAERGILYAGTAGRGIFRLRLR